MTEIVIVGAGPAGIAATSACAAHGYRPLVIDEGQHAGGQVYRRPTAPVRVDAERLLGAQAKGYRRVHDAFAGLDGRIDYRPETLVWTVADGRVHTLCGSQVGSQVGSHAYDALILATGATDRLIPVEGWTMPGVFSLGAAQVLLKDQGCLIGRSTVFCGSSPLLYLAALQYVRAGGAVAAVLDTAPWHAKAAALPRMAASPGFLSRGIGWMAALCRSGVPIRFGVRLLAIESGAEGAAGVRFQTARGREQVIAADAVALGFGLRGETPLLELAGCRLRFDAAQGQFLPEMDIDGRCGERVYAAGDGSAIGGADAAEASGRLAALAMLADFGTSIDHRERARLRARVARLRRLQAGLAAAFPLPDWPVYTADAVTLCRCENVSVGEVRLVLRGPLAPGDVNRAKALTRCGMGRCQGRYCGLALAQLMAAELRAPLGKMGWLRAQAPVKLLPLAAAVEPG